MTPLQVAQAQTLSDLQPILPFFSFTVKSELLKFCCGFELTGRTLAAFIPNSHLFGYVYYFADSHWIPSHLSVTEQVVEKFQKGDEIERLALIRKHLNVFDERKLFTGHLFYNHLGRWHLFFSNQRDRKGDHFRHGPHIHFVNRVMRPTTTLEQIVAELDANPPRVRGGTHIKFRN